MKPMHSFLVGALAVLLCLVFFSFRSTDYSSSESSVAQIGDKASVSPTIPDKTLQASPSDTKNEQVVVNTFELDASINGETLVFRLISDAPDFASVLVSVRRIIELKNDLGPWELGSDYFSEERPMSEWRDPVSVDVSDSAWRTASEENRKLAAATSSKITGIEDQVEIRAVLDAGQPSPMFAEDNLNLVGHAVTQTYTVKFVENEITVKLESIGSSPRSEYVAGHRLQPGGIYRVSKDIPLMPSSPEDATVDGLKNALKMHAGSVFEVILTRKFSGKPWYMVSVTTSRAGEMIVGWINSTALAGQVLVIISSGDLPVQNDDLTSRSIAQRDAQEDMPIGASTQISATKDNAPVSPFAGIDYTHFSECKNLGKAVMHAMEIAGSSSSQHLHTYALWERKCSLKNIWIIVDRNPEADIPVSPLDWAKL